jgi:hypothetical protein
LKNLQTLPEALDLLRANLSRLLDMPQSDLAQITSSFWDESETNFVDRFTKLVLDGCPSLKGGSFQEVPLSVVPGNAANLVALWALLECKALGQDTGWELRVAPETLMYLSEYLGDVMLSDDPDLKCFSEPVWQLWNGDQSQFIEGFIHCLQTETDED